MSTKHSTKSRCVTLLARSGAILALLVAISPLAPVGAATKKAAAPTGKQKTPVTAVATIAPGPTPTPGMLTLIALAKNRKTPVYRSSTDTKPFVTLDNAKNYSRRHVFTVIAGQGDGYLVNVPVRPNGTRGFVKAADVTLAKHDYLISVSLSKLEMTVFQGATELARVPVAIGQPKYPTPRGVFFTRELYIPKKTTGPYGTGAFGLSGYSNVLTEFGRGDGQIAIHGTNQPALLGKPVSHGCIRVDNSTIAMLAKTLPPGVPVVIAD